MSQDLVTENLELRNRLEQLFRQAQQNQQILQRFQAFDLQFIGASGFLELLDAIFRGFATASELDVVTLVLLDPDYDIRRILADQNIDPADIPQLLFLQDEAGFGALPGQLRKPVLGAFSLQMHGALFPVPLPTPASLALVPLRRHDRLIGCLCIGSRDEARFIDGMGTDFVEHMAAIVAVCLENAVNNERLKHIGLTDPLTGVHNRRYVERRLLEEIGRSRRQGYDLSCLYIDIDHFKQINDGLGHQAGDEVLRGIAGRIKEELRLSDALGRFGGEEFVVLLIDAGPTAAGNAAERIRQSIAEQPLALGDGQTLDVTVSIGVASLAQHDECEAIEATAQKFVARADQALYLAKQGGRNKIVAAG
ncbi:diguanylate cyclase [Noviherbaspirillum sp. UKPF54]|uniref:GGDEF domain-containing protein n=1 Tax=Noviherbaspirillum sp. UKPF54 TaxID=2601898 RepID=UPI0011B1ABC0|nr:sensor domain-containing diguanylate cyclase [Noviherbaspirillum sp. UKPF54]QDZ29066.1 sensor domain-containing diguanylate cyclase [Noviherbaspirillum sp. UKPF54]